ncbi:MAG: TonB-dependent receptor [Oligoflexus sp.]|nr:TonB-dependent receptor [Oligoflexus sp.]
MSRKIMNRFCFAPISISLLAALASFEAKAQEQNPVPPAAQMPDPAIPGQTLPAPPAAEQAEAKDIKKAGAPDSKQAERITVTGSRIKQIELEGPKPMVTIQAEEIKKSGATSVNDYLEKLTVASFGSASYGSGFGAAEGTQGFDIHGLGASNTLVLLNGKRLVRDPYLEIIDLSIIPTAAVERIEILTGTASAIYGTDAAAGVVNVITRKNYEGMAAGYGKVKSRYSGGGDHDQAYVVAGTSSDKSSNILTFQWDQDQPTYIGDRPWVQKNYRSIYGSPFGYYGADSKFHPGGACEEGSKTSAGNTFCQYNYMDDYQLGGAVQKISIMDDYTYNLTKNTKVGVRLFATKKTALTKGLKEPVDESDNGYMVSEAAINANHPELNTAAVVPQYMPNNLRGGANGVYVHGRLVGGPASRTATDQLTASGTTSLTHDFDNGDQIEASFSESRITRSHNWLNYFDNGRLGDAIWDGSYDVFANPAPGGLENYRVDLNDRDSSIARSFEVDYTGSFDFGSRNFGYALGISQIRESYLNQAPPNKIAKLLDDPVVEKRQGVIKGLGGGGGSGERKANAVFGEIKVPIVDTFEASVAARYDDYTDFGDAFNPALGLSYRIGKEWFFRANYGTGFKAPSLRDIHDSPATYYTSATDYLKCNVATAANDADNVQKYCEFGVSGTIVSGGNKDLRPETSQNWSASMAFEPVAGYGLSLEYYASKIEDGIGSVTAEQLTKMEANGTALPPGTKVIRDQTSGDITGFLSPTTNLSTTKTSGIGTKAYAKEDFSFGTLSYRTDYAYVLNYEKQELPGGPFQKQLDIYGPRWRWNNTIGYGIGIHEVALSNQAQARTFKGVQSYGYIGAYNFWNLNYAVDVTKNVTINVGGENIFNNGINQDNSDNVFRGGGVGMSYYGKVDFRM